MKKWLYHDEHDSKLVDLPDATGPQAHKLAEMYAEGWRDSPADLPAQPGYHGSIGDDAKEEGREAEQEVVPVIMRAKLHVSNVQPFDGGEVLTFAAVCADSYSKDGIDENNTFSRFTPAADLRMTTQNPDLIGALPAGSVYYVDFTLAEPAPIKAAEDQPLVRGEETTDAGEGENTASGADDVIEHEEDDEDEAAALLVQFQTDPRSMNKDQYVKLGAALGLRLMKAWNEDTLINKINEALTNGDTEKPD